MADTVKLAVMVCGECGQRFGADARFCPFDGAMLEPLAVDPTGDPLIGKVIDARYDRHHELAASRAGSRR